MDGRDQTKIARRARADHSKPLDAGARAGRQAQGHPVVNSDITEKKQLESQLLRGQRLESIGTLASGLAHDLNNVLAPIMMAVQFIKDNTEDDGMRACFQTLETCSRRGADIIRQVLMFARGVEGERILLNPKHLIQEMQRIANETFPRSIEINTRISQQPCVLLGDATQIQQVIMNLCVNARDAMPQGGVLTIGLDKKELDAAGAAHSSQGQARQLRGHFRDRYRHGHSARTGGQNFRSVFHHQAAGPGHRPGFAHGAGHRRKSRRLCASRNQARRRHDLLRLYSRRARRSLGRRKRTAARRSWPRAMAN